MSNEYDVLNLKKITSQTGERDFFSSLFFRDLGFRSADMALFLEVLSLVLLGERETRSPLFDRGETDLLGGLKTK